MPVKEPSSTRSIDSRYAELLAKHAGEDLTVANLNVFARRMYFSKMLVHFEVYRQVAHLPGDIVECGVFRGESLLNFARFVEMLNTGDRSKRVIGFDHFRGFEDLTAADGFDPRVGNEPGGWNAGSFRDTLVELIELFHRDSFVPAKPRIQLVEGDIRVTAPAFADREPGLRIALLHLDCDMYEPTLAALEAFYPRVLPGGIVLLDEYGMPEWPGESKALDEYFEGNPPEMRKSPWNSAPGGWFVRPRD